MKSAVNGNITQRSDDLVISSRIMCTYIYTPLWISGLCYCHFDLSWANKWL